LNAKDSAIVYDAGLLVPFGSKQWLSEPEGSGIYRYRWPELTSLPTSLVVCAGHQSTNPGRVQLPLVPDEAAPVPWQAKEDADWLTVTPNSGQLPATLTLSVDGGGLTLPAQTVLAIEVHWSPQQVESIVLPVRCIDCRAWLPLTLGRR
jgi:hypothetical protein